MDAGPQCHRTVHTTPGDYNVRTFGQRRRNARRTQIGVHRHQFWRHGCAAEHFLHTRTAHRVGAVKNVIAGYHGDFQLQAQLIQQRLHRPAAGKWINTACIGNNPDALTRHFGKNAAQHAGNEIQRISLFRIFRPRTGHDRHGDFRQIIEHQIIDIAIAHQLLRAHARIAPKAGGTANANGFLSAHIQSLPMIGVHFRTAGRQRQSAWTGCLTSSIRVGSRQFLYC